MFKIKQLNNDVENCIVHNTENSAEKETLWETKEVIRSRQSKKDRQYNHQAKMDKRTMIYKTL